MPAEIDRLEIAIEAKSKGASDQIDALIGKLDSLSNALARTATTGFKSMSDAANHASTCIRNLSTSINNASLNKVNAQLTALSKVDLSNLNKDITIDIKLDGTQAQKNADAVYKSNKQIEAFLKASAKEVANTYHIASNEAKKALDEIFLSMSHGHAPDISNEQAALIRQSVRMTEEEQKALRAGTIAQEGEYERQLRELKSYLAEKKILLTKDVAEQAKYNQYIGQGGQYNYLLSKKGGLDLTKDASTLTSKFKELFSADFGTAHTADQLEYIVGLLEKANSLSALKPLSNSSIANFGKSMEAELTAALERVNFMIDKTQANLSKDKIYVDVEVNQEKIIADIQSAVNKAATVKYNPVNVSLKADTTQIKHDIAGQFEGISLEGIESVNLALQKLNTTIRQLTEAQTGANFGKITNFVKNLSEINMGNASTVSTSLSELSTGIAAIVGASGSSDAISNIKKIANALKKIQEVDPAKLQLVGQAITELAANISGIQSGTDGSNNLVEILKTIRKFSNKGISAAIQNIPNLAKAINELLTSLASAPAINPDTLATLQAAAALRVRSGADASQAQGQASRAVPRSSLGSSIGSAGAAARNAVKGVGSGLGKAGQAIWKANKGAIQATTSLFNRLGGVGKSAISAGKRLYDFSKRTSNSVFSVRGLTSALSRLYMKFFILRRVIRWFSYALTSSMNYIESYHYFETAFGKIGEGSKNQFSEYGYESAEAYADSFRKRVLALNEKMSGFKFDDSGFAQSTGEKSLGLDSDQLLQFQAQYAQMADSMGMTGEAATATSKALTMLASDWSSLRNIPFEDSFQKMTSALAGQSRAVRTLGIDITQASLAETAARIGMTQSITKMSQVEKAELRVITMLEQSRVAWGDLAKTLNTPANQLRMLKQNLKSLARTIGNLFLPALAKIIPYINGIVIALQRLFQWIANVLGLNAAELVSSAGGLDDALGDLDTDDFTEGVKDADDALKEAEEDAEELVKTILGFDELNILNPPEEKKEDEDDKNKADEDAQLADLGLLDSALLDLLDEYEKAWEKAFEDMASAAHEFAAKLEEIGRKIWDFIKNKDYEGLGEYLAAGVNWILQKLYDLLDPERFKALVYPIIDAFTQTFNSLVDFIDWDLMGRVLGRGINDLVDAAIRALEGIDWYNLGRKIAEGINGLVDEIEWEDIGRLIGDKINSIVEWLHGFLEGLDGKAIGEGLAAMLNKAIETIKWAEIGDTMALGINKAIDILDAFIDNFQWEELALSLAEMINSFIEGVEWARLGQVLGKLVDKLLFTISTCVKNIKWKELAINLSNALTMFIASVHWKERAAELAEAFNTVLDGIYTGFTTFNWKWAGEQFGAAISELFAKVNWYQLGQNLSWSINSMLLYVQGLMSAPGFFSGLGSSFAELLNGALSVGTLVTAAEALSTAINGLLDSAKAFITDFHWWTLGDQLKTSLNLMIEKIHWREIGDTFNSWLTKALQTLTNAAKGVNWEELGENVAEMLKEVEWLKHFNDARDIILDSLGAFFSGMLAEALGPFGEHFADGFVKGVKMVIDLNESLVMGIAGAIKALGEAIESIDPAVAEAVGGALGAFFAFNIAAGLAAKITGVVTALTGLKGLTAGGFAGNVTGAAGALTKFAGALKTFGVASVAIGIHTAMEETVGEGSDFGGVDGVTNTVKGMLDEVSASIEQIGKNSAISEEQIGKVRDKLAEISQETSALDAFQRAAEELHNAGISSTELKDALGGLTGDQKTVYDFLVGLENGVKGVGDSTDKTKEKTEDLKRETENLYTYLDMTNFDKPITSYVGYIDILDKVIEKYEATNGNMRDLRKAILDTVAESDSASVAYGKIKEAVENLGLSTQGVDDVFREEFPEAVRTGTGEATSEVESSASAIKENLNGAFEEVEQTATESIGNVNEKIGETGSSADEAQKNLDPFTKLIDDLAKNTSLPDTVKIAIISAAIAAIADGSGESQTALHNLSEEIQNYASNDDLINHTNDIVTALEDSGTSIDGFCDAIEKSFGDANAAITPEIAEILAQIEDMARETKSGMHDAAVDGGEGFIEGSEEKKGGIIDTAIGVAESVVSAVRGIFDSHSPSRVFREIGWDVDLGLAQGIEEFMSEPIDAIKMLAIEMQNEFGDIARDIPDAFSNISSDIASNFYNVGNEISNAIGDMFSLGRDVSQAFADGIQSVYIKLPHVYWSGDLTHTYDGGTIYIPQFAVEWYASGGFPAVGDLFMANERGPEMVGKMGHRNVVANNMQIVEGIKEGFIDAVMEVAMSGGSSDDVPYQMNINLVMPDGEVLARQVDRGRMKREERFRFA